MLIFLLSRQVATTRASSLSLLRGVACNIPGDVRCPFKEIITLMHISGFVNSLSRLVNCRWTEHVLSNKRFEFWSEQTRGLEQKTAFPRELGETTPILLRSRPNVGQFSVKARTMLCSNSNSKFDNPEEIEGPCMSFQHFHCKARPSGWKNGRIFDSRQPPRDQGPHANVRMIKRNTLGSLLPLHLGWSAYPCSNLSGYCRKRIMAATVSKHGWRWDILTTCISRLCLLIVVCRGILPSKGMRSNWSLPISWYLALFFSYQCNRILDFHSHIFKTRQKQLIKLCPCSGRHPEKFPEHGRLAERWFPTGHWLCRPIRHQASLGTMFLPAERLSWPDCSKFYKYLARYRCQPRGRGYDEYWTTSEVWFGCPDRTQLYQSQWPENDPGRLQRGMEEGKFSRPNLSFSFPSQSSLGWQANSHKLGWQVMLWRVHGTLPCFSSPSVEWHVQA